MEYLQMKDRYGDECRKVSECYREVCVSVVKISTSRLAY